jgi:NADH:ubiquinone oxidoreductase subunit E
VEAIIGRWSCEEHGLECELRRHLETASREHERTRARESLKEEVREILERYRHMKGRAMPVLLDIQERFGYVPEEAVRHVAKWMRVSPSEIFGLMTFHEGFQFETEEP